MLTIHLTCQSSGVLLAIGRMLLERYSFILNWDTIRSLTAFLTQGHPHVTTRAFYVEQRH